MSNVVRLPVEDQQDAEAGGQDRYCEDCRYVSSCEYDISLCMETKRSSGYSGLIKPAVIEG